MNRSTIRTKARRKLDELSEKFWDDDDLNDYIDDAVKFYWLWMIENGHPATLKSELKNITANTATVALPSDYFSTDMIERVLSNATTTPISFKQRKETSNPPSSASGDDYRPNYRFVGSDFVLEPAPQFTLANGLKHTYYFVHEDITIDADTPRSILGTIFGMMIVNKVVFNAKTKEESLDPGGGDLGPIKIELSEQEAKFKSMIDNPTAARQSAEPFSTGDGDFY